MDKDQKPSDSEWCTPSLEDFRFYIWDIFIKLASCDFIEIHPKLVKQQEMHFVLSLATQFISLIGWNISLLPISEDLKAGSVLVIVTWDWRHVLWRSGKGWGKVRTTSTLLWNTGGSLPNRITERCRGRWSSQLPEPNEWEPRFTCVSH
jgi:hypothetical protein